MLEYYVALIFIYIKKYDINNLENLIFMYQTLYFIYNKKLVNCLT